MENSKLFTELMVARNKYELSQKKFMSTLEKIFESPKRVKWSNGENIISGITIEISEDRIKVHSEINGKEYWIRQYKILEVKNLPMDD